MTQQISRLQTSFGILIVVFIFFNVIFPKGGVKLGDAPLTNGYIVMGLIFTYGIIHAVAERRIMNWEMAVLGLMLPFQIWVLYTYYYLGFDPVSGSFGIGQLILYIALPFLFFLGASFIIRHADMTAPATWLVWGLRFVAVFGIVQFFYFYVFQEFIEVPFLIVNLADIGELGEKHNMRGEFSKLISTYNNGNIYAVCMCMMAPLYLWLEKKGFWKIVFLVALFLTLSRTGWIGLLLVLIYEFRNMEWGIKKIFGTVAAATLVLMVPVVAPEWFGLNEDFFTDTELGGRAAYLEQMWEIGFLPTQPLGEYKEVVYFSVAWAYGVSGLMLFLVFITAPILVAAQKGGFALPASQRILAGLIIYLIMSCSDGAILFPPTLTIYYFMAVCALNHAFDRLPASAPAPTPKRSVLRPSAKASRPIQVGGIGRGGLVSAMIMHERTAEPGRS